MAKKHIVHEVEGLVMFHRFAYGGIAFYTVPSHDGAERWIGESTFVATMIHLRNVAGFLRAESGPAVRRGDAVFARRYIDGWPKVRQRRARGLTSKDMEVLHRFIAHLSTSRERRRLDWDTWLEPRLPKVLAGFRMFLDDLPEDRRHWFAECDESLRRIGF